jgi:Protein of unknown function (DUF1203)
MVAAARGRFADLAHTIRFRVALTEEHCQIHGMITYLAMPTEQARQFQLGAPDAFGLPPERAISDGDGVPCRHCLHDVAAGEPYLILAYRPFPDLQPFAETGPIFLHAEPCARATDANTAPPNLTKRKAHLVKGYSKNNRIVYGTGKIAPSAELDAEAENILKRDDVAYVHVRSAVNNCYTCRIERG